MKNLKDMAEDRRKKMDKASGYGDDESYEAEFDKEATKIDKKSLKAELKAIEDELKRAKTKEAKDNLYIKRNKVYEKLESIEG